METTADPAPPRRLSQAEVCARLYLSRGGLQGAIRQGRLRWPIYDGEPIELAPARHARRRDRWRLSVSEVAEALGVTRPTVYAAIRAGRLRWPVRVGEPIEYTPARGGWPVGRRRKTT